MFIFCVYWWIFCGHLTGTQVPRYLVKHYSGCGCEGVSEVRLTFESTDWVEQITLPSVGSLTQPTEGLHGTESWIWATSYWLLSSWDTSLPLSDWNVTTASPGSPSYRGWIWGFSASITTIMLIIQIIFIYNIYKPYWLCFSVGPWPIQGLNRRKVENCQPKTQHKAVSPLMPLLIPTGRAQHALR